VRQAWGDHVGANPVDRGKPGSKLHLVTDGQGLPLAVAVTAANVNDSTMFEGLLDDVPAVCTPSVGGAAGPTSCMRTRDMTPGVAAPISAAVGSRLGSHGAGSSRRPGSAGTAGAWSGPCRG
jgi:Transposase DDE domain